MKKLTLKQIMKKYVKGNVDSYWENSIKMILQLLNPNGGKWVWPAAGLCFTRIADDCYLVQRA